MNEICKCQCEYQTCKVEITNEVSTPKYCIAYPEKQAYWKTVSAGVPKIENEDVDLIKEKTTMWYWVPNWIKEELEDELRWACEKHPKFPNDPFQMMCIIQEELGEAIQALNNLKHHQQGVIKDVNIELLHTIVTCLRTLMAINEKEKY